MQSRTSISSRKRRLAGCVRRSQNKTIGLLDNAYINENMILRTLLVTPAVVSLDKDGSQFGSAGGGGGGGGGGGIHYCMEVPKLPPPQKTIKRPSAFSLFQSPAFLVWGA